MSVRELLIDLIKIPSPSGEEKEMGEFISERLKKNFKVQIQNVGGRFNLLAYKGIPRIILNAHLDTVPKQLEIKEDNECIYGRGACDTKSSIASMIIAGEELIKQGKNNFGLLFNVGEELDFSGVKEAINLIDPEYVIIGEPTNFNAIVGQKGLLGIKIKCFGKSAPGSTPEEGISAINKLVEDLSKLNKTKLPKGILGETTLNIGKISGGIAQNVVPDYAEAIVEFRTTIPNIEILNLLNQLNINFEILSEYDFVKLENLDLIRKLNIKEENVSYFTEMYFWSKKAKVIVFGPGEYKYAHSDKEQIKKEDLDRAVKEYIRILNYLCD